MYFCTTDNEHNLKSTQRLMKKYILCCIILLLAAGTQAQDSYNDRVKKYVDQYYALAIAEQKTSGIPASITLGQGILETEAGASELMTQANNHFGIKCKNDWTGETFTHDDDAPGECFKKYSCAADSYRDHSRHLKINPRYAPLFTLSKTDYASWAIGLKKCGYATNPQYAQKLIKIIEDFKLQDYTYSALDNAEVNNYPTIPKARIAAAAIKATADTTEEEDDSTEMIKANVAPARTSVAGISKVQPHADTPVVQKPVLHARIDTPKKLPPVIRNTGIAGKYEDGKIVTVNGLRAFYALKGEMLLQYAVKLNIRYPHLLEMNDLPDAPLPFNMYVYLDKKPGYGIHTKHTVTEGENMLMIAQEEAIQLKRLCALNYFTPTDKPATGAVLELQTQAARKPDTRLGSPAAQPENRIAAGSDVPVKEDNDYIALRKSVDSSEGEESTTRVNDHSAAKEDNSKEEDLSGLKAELDKVVYADDSKQHHTKSVAGNSKPVKQPVKAAPKKVEKFYTVRRGDTASAIAKKHDITVRQLTKWNDIDADDIRPGDRLRVKQ
jgi:LysM repeat protein